MAEYRTKAGDMLDRVCYRHYRRVDRITQVLDANFGLVEHGPILPAGLVITLPAIVVEADLRELKLWD